MLGIASDTIAIAHRILPERGRVMRDRSTPSGVFTESGACTMLPVQTITACLQAQRSRFSWTMRLRHTTTSTVSDRLRVVH